MVVISLPMKVVLRMIGHQTEVLTLAGQDNDDRGEGDLTVQALMRIRENIKVNVLASKALRPGPTPAEAVRVPRDLANPEAARKDSVRTDGADNLMAATVLASPVPFAHRARSAWSFPCSMRPSRCQNCHVN